MSGVIEIALGASTGFSIFQLTCPSHKFLLDKRLPRVYKTLSSIKRKFKATEISVKSKNIEVLPSVRLNFKKRSIWIHHWMWLSILLAYLSVNAPQEYLFAKSLFAGGVVHGFIYKDRFKILSSN